MDLALILLRQTFPWFEWRLSADEKLILADRAYLRPLPFSLRISRTETDFLVEADLHRLADSGFRIHAADLVTDLPRAVGDVLALSVAWCRSHAAQILAAAALAERAGYPYTCEIVRPSGGVS